MSLLVLGANYRQTSVALREKVAVRDEDLSEAYSEILALPDVTEAVVLSTCNRCELYLDVKTDVRVRDDVRELLERRSLTGEELRELHECSYALSGADMVSHLFSVAASLDSQVLGDEQVLGQLKEAYRRACDSGACADVFGHLFQQALQTGKRVRSETAIGRGSTSIALLAVRRATRASADLSGCTACVVGAGDMGSLVCRYLADAGIGSLTVANRHVASARSLARSAGGKGFSLRELPQLLEDADVALCTTSAPGYVVDPDMLGERPASRPLLLVDIAMPRDVDPACAQVAGVTVCDLDDLGGELDRTRTTRLQAAGAAERLVAEEVERFARWMQERSVAPTIEHIYEKVEHVCAVECDKAQRALEQVEGRELTERERAVLTRLSRAVGRKIAHGPTIRLKRQSHDPASWRYTDAARYLFGLDSSPIGRACRSCPVASRCHRNEGGPCLMAAGDL